MLVESPEGPLYRVNIRDRSILHPTLVHGTRMRDFAETLTLLTEKFNDDDPWTINKVLYHFAGYSCMPNTRYCCNKYRDCGGYFDRAEFQQHLLDFPSHCMLDEEGKPRTRDWYVDQKREFAKWDR